MMGKLFGGGSGGGSSQTTESSPWKPAQGALESILGQAGEIYDKNGGLNGNWIDKELADLTPEMQQAVKDMLNSDSMKETVGNINNAAQQGMSGIGQATGALGGLTQQGITSDDINNMAKDLYDNEMVASQKEQLGKDVQHGLDKNVQQLNQQSSGSGNMGSSRAGVAQGVMTGEAMDAVAQGNASIENSARNQAYGQALGTLQGNQSTALGAAGQLGNLGLGSGSLMSGTLGAQQNILGNQLTGAGILQNQAQNQLNNNWFNQQGQANAGWDNISKYLGIAGSIGGMGGSSTTTGSSSTGTLGGLQGLVGMGSTIAGMFSDASLKKNVKATGKKTKGGNKEYEWEWNDSAKKRVGKKGKDKGVLAQEVAKKDKSAVGKDKKTGRLMVDYDKA
ncbi:MAG: hypothetical protein ACRC6V_05120 [Bacteroidales bacterium]